MSEVATPAAPAAPAAAATTAEPKPHHSTTQPREVGKFAGPPQPGAPAAETPPPPQKWKVGDEEIDDPAELARLAMERTVDHRAFSETQRAAARLEAELRAAKAQLERAQRGEVLDAETRQRIALEEARRYQEEQELAALPEEQRRFYLHMKQVQREAAEAKAKLAEIERARAEAEEQKKQEAEQQQRLETQKKLAGDIRSAMEATGLALSNDLARMVSAEMRASIMAGVDPTEYPPEVLARRVLKRFNATVSEQVKARAAKPETLFRDIPTLVDALNNLEDPAVLRSLGKLGDRLRRLNLEASGLRPQVVQPPTAPVSGTASNIDTSKLKPGSPEWEDVIRQRSRR